MPLIKQWMLDQMRAVQDDNLFDTCTIRHYVSRVNTGYGGANITWSNELDVPCRLWISSGPNGTSNESRFYGDSEVNNTDAFLIVSWNQVIDVKDLIIYQGRTYSVVGVQSDDSIITAKRVRVQGLRDKGE